MALARLANAYAQSVFQGAPALLPMVHVCLLVVRQVHAIQSHTNVSAREALLDPHAWSLSRVAQRIAITVASA